MLEISVKMSSNTNQKTEISEFAVISKCINFPDFMKYTQMCTMQAFFPNPLYLTAKYTVLHRVKMAMNLT